MLTKISMKISRNETKISMKFGCYNWALNDPDRVNENTYIVNNISDHDRLNKLKYLMSES